MAIVDLSKKLTKQQVIDLATTSYGVEYAALQAVIEVESSGSGYDLKTGKIKIQFETSWFKRKYADWKKADKSTIWLANKVGIQSEEWAAFSDAFNDDATAAMEATSIGLMQVMGFHWKLLGFASVGEMWDYAKASEANQLDLGLRFIKSNIRLYTALKNKDWATFAYYYNGAAYRTFKYDIRLAHAYKDAS